MTVNRRRMLCLALALGMLLSLIPSGLSGHLPALAAGQRLGITTMDKVNVRYGPATNEKIMFTAPKDHVCIIKETTTNQGIRWYKVETSNPERQNGNTYIGYIHGDFFREMSESEVATYNAGGSVSSGSSSSSSSSGGSAASSSTVSGGRSKDLAAKSGSMGAVTAGGTNFREGPGTGYRSIERLDRNTQVELITIPSVRGPGTGTFYKVKYNNVTGYIMSDFITIISGGPVSEESESSSASSGSDSGSGSSSGSGSDSGSGSSSGSGSDSGSGSSSSSSSSSASSSDYTHVRLILSSCHMRVSPGGDYDSDNDWLGQGNTLPLAGKAVKQGGYTWYPVAKNGKTYYVRNDCVQPFSAGGSTTAAAETPAASTTTTAETTSSANVLGYVKTIMGGVNLRATISGTVIKQVGKNETFPYLQQPVQKNGYTWYYVQAGSNRGYLRSDVVTVVGGSGSSGSETPAASTETSTPAEEATGYVKTTASGVNLRMKAGYTDVIGRVNRDVVMPYYGTPTTVKGVKWYYVKHPTLGHGYLHGDYVTPCDSNGNPISSGSSGSSSGSSSGTVTPATSGQEASYNTLKVGSTGTAVKNLVNELKNQGYYSGTVTNKYTTAVESAVKAFQKANDLSVDGIAGSATQHKLFGTVPIGAGDNSNLTMTLYPAEKIDWYTGGINELWARGSNYKVYDVKTGIVWWAHRWAGGLHVDAEPLTAADTARLCKCYGVSTSQEIKDKNLYQRRPLLVTIGTRTFACSLYGVPHNYPDGDTISTNDFKGQVCIHFTNSKTHDSRKVDSGHEEAIQYAWEHAPNGHK